MADKKPPQKSLLYNAIIVLIVLMFLNAFIFPLFTQPRVTQVSYDSFLEMLDAGNVREVARDGDTIMFTAVDDASGEEHTRIYKTGAWPDDDLTQRLLEHPEVSFESSIVEETSPITEFLFGWLLPYALIFGLGYLLMRSLQKRMGGGNAMSFGKADAKIVGEEKTGVTFADVAGEDEAKEALSEIVNFLHDPAEVLQDRRAPAQGRAAGGPSGHGQDAAGPRGGGRGACAVFLDLRLGICADVRGHGRGQGARPVQAGGREGAVHRVHRRDRHHRQKARRRHDRRKRRARADAQPASDGDGRLRREQGRGHTGRDQPPGLAGPGASAAGPVSTGACRWSFRTWRGARAILRVHARNVKLEQRIDLGAIARATSGASGAELANIINEAALRAVREGREAVSQDDLEESVETVIAGYQRKNAVLSEHESAWCGLSRGRARAGGGASEERLAGDEDHHRAQDSGALGYTMQVDQDEKKLLTREELLARSRCSPAGARRRKWCSARSPPARRTTSSRRRSWPGR